MDLVVKVGDPCCHGGGGAGPRPDVGSPGRSVTAFAAAMAALFVASAAITIGWCASMAAMPGMSMPGGWTMSMAWMRMPEQTWPGAAASFLGMWTVMMVAMMVPSLAPVLWRHRLALGDGGDRRVAAHSLLVAAGYFLVWSAQGALLFPLGVAVAAATMRWPLLARAVPPGVAIVVLGAGVLQVTPWKARHLACCRRLPRPKRDAPSAWQQGLRLGLHCSACCAGLTAVLLVVGVMDLAVMAAVTVAITAERLAGVRIARAIGAILLAAGLFVLVRAI